MLHDRKLRSALAKTRMGTLPVTEETGRYRKIPLDQRLCIFCDKEAIETSTHLLLHCTKYSDLRKTLFDRTMSDNVVHNDDGVILKYLLSPNSSTNAYAVSKFLTNAMILRCHSAS